MDAPSANVPCINNAMSEAIGVPDRERERIAHLIPEMKKKKTTTTVAEYN